MRRLTYSTVLPVTLILVLIGGVVRGDETLTFSGLADLSETGGVKGKALDIARYRALRRAAEYAGVQVQAETAVKNFVVEYNVIRTKVRARVTNIVEIYADWDRGDRTRVLVILQARVKVTPSPHPVPPRPHPPSGAVTRYCEFNLARKRYSRSNSIDKSRWYTCPFKKIGAALHYHGNKYIFFNSAGSAYTVFNKDTQQFSPVIPFVLWDNQKTPFKRIGAATYYNHKTVILFNHDGSAYTAYNREAKRFSPVLPFILWGNQRTPFTKVGAAAYYKNNRVALFNKDGSAYTIYNIKTKRFSRVFPFFMWGNRRPPFDKVGAAMHYSDDLIVFFAK